MRRISAAWRPLTTVLAAAGVTAVMTTTGLAAPAAAAVAPSAGCVWLPPFPSATVNNPVGETLYPCGDKGGPGSS
jgi:hypothetical protein